MASTNTTSPVRGPVVDLKTGHVTKAWLRFFASLSPSAASTTETATAPAASATSTPTGSALSASGDTNVSIALSGTPAFALLEAVQITLAWAGLLGLGRGGTNADLSATGGPSQFLRQNSAGAAVDVVQPAVSDLSDGAHVIVDTGAYSDPAWVTDIASAKLTGTVADANLQSVNADVGAFGSATKTVTVTADAKGRITAITEQTVTPAAADLTGTLGLTQGGTGAATAAGAIAALGLKAQRVTTGAIGAGVSALVTLTWAVAFVDANYTVAVSVLDSTAAVASLQVVHVESVTATAVVVRVQNTSAGALTGTLQVIGIHD